MTISETRISSLKELFESAAVDAVQVILDRIPDCVDAASGMLPPECYTSPEFFEFERSRIFPVHGSVLAGLSRLPIRVTAFLHSRPVSPFWSPEPIPEKFERWPRYAGIAGR